MNKSQTHYHVFNGLHGCLPDGNNCYTTLREAREDLKDVVRNLREGGMKFTGNLKHGNFEQIDGNYYADIETCQEPDCLKNQELEQ